MLVHVETALEKRVRNAPSIAWIRVAGSDVGRSGATGEEPDLDEIRAPFRSVDTSVSGVESCAEREALGICYLTSSIGPLPWSVDIATRGDQLTGEIGSILY